MELEKIQPVANDIVDFIRPYCARAEVAGSIRRQKADVKDVEIVAIDDSTVAPAIEEKKSGLGTRIFNLASDGRWSIKRIGSTTEFRLTMTLEN